MKNIDLISYEENLNKFLRLNSFPVAIKFLKNLEEIHKEDIDKYNRIHIESINIMKQMKLLDKNDR